MSGKKIGVILSYASLLISSVLSILLTPFMLRTMGDIEYGLYQTISSFIGVLVILDFGTGVTTTKYISEYNLKNDIGGRNNYIFMAIIINTIISILITSVGICFIFFIDSIYSNTFTSPELVEAKILAFLYLINVIITVFSNMFQGVIIGCKKFAYANLLSLLKVIIRYALVYILLCLNLGAIAISIADILASIVFIIGCILYSIIKLKAYPKFIEWNNNLFWASITFSMALFLQSIVTQINNSIDKVLLGSLLGGGAVAVYAIAMNIYLIYGSLAGAIRRILLPDAVELIDDKADGNRITDFVIEGGRYQFIFLIYILCGFVLVGNEFIDIWVGDNYRIAYYIALILMIPTLFQLSTNVTETILDAMGKRMVRSVILTIGAGFNIILTVILVKRFGVIGAPIGTAVSCVLSALIVLNIYHKRIMDLHVIKMFRGICHNTLICAIVAMLPAALIGLIHLPTLLTLILKGSIYSVSYCILMWIWGFNKKEKEIARGFFNIIKKK